MGSLKFVCLSSYVGSLLSLLASCGAMVKQSQVVPVRGGEPVLAGVLMAEAPALSPNTVVGQYGTAARYLVGRSPRFLSQRSLQIVVPFRQRPSLQQPLALGDRPSSPLHLPQTVHGEPTTLSMSNSLIQPTEQVTPLAPPITQLAQFLPQQVPPAAPASAARGLLDPAQMCSDTDRLSAARQKSLSGLVATDRTLEGIASWYGPYFHGRQTASGEVFNQEALTAAHPTLPFDTVLEVTNLQNRNRVIVRINDRGPYIGRRSLDLSRRAARCLGSIRAGIVPYRARVLKRLPASPSPQDR